MELTRFLTHSVPADPVAFLDEGGAEDFGENVCEGEGGLVDLVEAALAGGECEIDPESDACYDELSLLLCDTDAHARTLADCGNTLIAGAIIPHKPRCHRTAEHNCLCKESWNYEGDAYENRACAPETETDFSWCNVVEGSCDESFDVEGRDLETGDCTCARKKRRTAATHLTHPSLVPVHRDVWAVGQLRPVADECRRAHCLGRGNRGEADRKSVV